MRAATGLVVGGALGVAIALATVDMRSGAMPSVACPPPGRTMTRIELLFGLGRPQGGTIGEAAWQAFLDAQITPRFPDGLTALTGYGQWRGPSGRLDKETSRMLLVWVRPSADNTEKIEAIREAWKSAFHQESVMRVEGTSCVSF